MNKELKQQLAGALETEDVPNTNPNCKACNDTGKNSRGNVCKACGGEGVELLKEMERADDDRRRGKKKISKPKQQIVKTKTKVAKKVAVKRVKVKTAKVKSVQVKTAKVKATKKIVNKKRAVVKKAAVKEVKTAKEEPTGCTAEKVSPLGEPHSNNWMLTRLKNSAVLAFTLKTAYQYRRELRGMLDKADTLEKVAEVFFAEGVESDMWKLFLSHFFNLHKF